MDRGELNLMQVMGLLELRLRTTEPMVLPRAVAPVLHGAIHRLLEGFDPAYGRQIHGRQLKPLSISPPRLCQAPDRELGGASLMPGALLAVRIGVLEASLLGILLAELLAHRQTAAPLSLDGRGAVVEEVRLIGGPISYHRFARLARPISELRFQFVTPTIVRRKREDKPITGGPEPRLLFGGYPRRWRAFAPADLALTVTEESIAANIALVAGQCVPHRVDLGKFRQHGFTGWARYRIDGDDRFRAEIATLAAYSAYCGTGARTAYGMGQTIVHSLQPPGGDVPNPLAERASDPC
ncbi:MAG: CRISPR system precrRNA processing endoribonuclease RAMP protein Cas6 [Chloroflexota bacterium]|nr:CRISPR system precrRNA processing endoribonuclease RAMP protein Cas6 [Chloroflexota bacterium]